MPTLGNVPRPGYVYDTETDTWVPIGVGAHTHAYIPNTLVDAKGDIVTASASDTPAILTRGANGTILVSDSTTSTGLAWQPYGAQFVAGKNKILNGALDIWQRGTSFTSGGYAADRWRISNGAGNTVSFSQQLFTGATIPSAGYEYQYFARIQRTVSAADTYLLSRQEDVRTLAGQTVTLSFWAKSSSSFTINPTDMYLYQYFGDGGSGANAVSINTSPVTFGTSWNRYTFTFNNSSVISQTITTRNFFEIAIKLVAAIGNFTLDIWGMQLEAGSTATPFTTATGTIQGELAACQRYYYKIGPSDGSSSSFLYSPLGMANATTQVIITFPFPQIMRVKPTSIEYTNPRVSDGANVSTATSLILGDASSSLGSVNVNGSGFTLFRNYWMMNNSNSSLAFSAEL